MGERKVLNKYFPPDFDPSKLPKGKRPDHNSMKVRMMLPMSVRCNTCGNFMYKGTKFNCKKQDVEGENYLGIQLLRFYFRCAACSAEFILKTDPANTDYTMEKGATRNYEPWREKERDVAQAVADREEEERGNAMKALENRTLDSKREMDIMSALDELKSMSSRHERVDTEAALAALKRSAVEEGEPEIDLDEEDEAAIRHMILQQQRGSVRRLEDSPPPEASTAGEPSASSEPEPQKAAAQKKPDKVLFGVRAKPLKVVAKKKMTVPEQAAATADSNGHSQAQEQQNGDAVPAKSNGSADGGGALLGLGSYGSESD